MEPEEMILFNVLILQIRNGKTMEWLAQGHTASQRQNSDENRVVWHHALCVEKLY